MNNQITWKAWVIEYTKKERDAILISSTFKLDKDGFNQTVCRLADLMNSDSFMTSRRFGEICLAKDQSEEAYNKYSNALKYGDTVESQGQSAMDIETDHQIELHHKLGLMYYEEDDYKSASVIWKQLASEVSEVEYQVWLGRALECQDKYKEAFSWYEKAALSNNAEAQFLSGRCYLEGDRLLN